MENGEEAEVGMGTMARGKYCELKCSMSSSVFTLCQSYHSLLHLASVPLQKAIQSLCVCNVISH